MMYLFWGILSIAAARVSFNPYIQGRHEDNNFPLLGHHSLDSGQYYFNPQYSYYPRQGHHHHHHHHQFLYGQSLYSPNHMMQYPYLSHAHRSPYCTPVYLHSDGSNRALLLVKNAQSLDRSVYSRFWMVRPLFCISQMPTHQTPTPLYAYRLNQGRGKYNHFYTTNVHEIGATRQGQTGRHGYQCLGILGYVGTRVTRNNALTHHSNMIPVYRWFSGRLQQHLFDPDPGLGARLNQGFGPEGIMAYTIQC